MLMALVDAECRFIYIDVGCNGRCHDAGVLLQCDLKNVLDDAENHFPADKIIGNGRKLPYVIVGDDAFPLRKHIMKPYSYKSMAKERQIFNIRLSRARHVVEHAFGILSNRFRIFQQRINLKVETVELVTKTCCVLHNLLCKKAHLICSHLRKVCQNIQKQFQVQSTTIEKVLQKTLGKDLKIISITKEKSTGKTADYNKYQACTYICM